jgi:hypothetical protein
MSSPHAKAGWDVVAPGAERASSHQVTQQAAVDRAREIVRNEGGGELVDSVGGLASTLLLCPDVDVVHHPHVAVTEAPGDRLQVAGRGVGKARPGVPQPLEANHRDLRRRVSSSSAGVGRSRDGPVSPSGDMQK